MNIVTITFLLALALTAVSTPAMRRLALWLGFVDLPADRKLHREPVPLLGGVAITGGATVAFLIFLIQFNLTPRVIGVLLGITMMALLGLIDDRWNLSIRSKLVAQILVVLLLALLDVRVRLPIPDLVNYLITLLWVVGISNAMNLLDNMDGLCAGVCAVASAFIVLAAALSHQVLVSALGAAVLGSCLGFLRYNFKPAAILMGDAGSLFLGFVLSVLGLLLRFPENVNLVTWMVPVFFLGLPIFDTSLVVLSRIRRGVNPLTAAGKDHTSHRLVQLGFSEREAVLILYLISGVFGMVGILISRSGVAASYALAFTVACLGILAIFRLEKVYRGCTRRSD